MIIEKFGHSCFLLSEKNCRILVDPGNLSNAAHLKKIDAILITHEHADHGDRKTLRKLMKKNPKAIVYSSERTAEKVGISCVVVRSGKEINVKGIKIVPKVGIHNKHFPHMPDVQNTSYMIAAKIFFPGDSFARPHKKPKYLALPVVASWTKTSEIVEYALSVSPKVCLAAHDGMLIPGKEGGFHYLVAEHVAVKKIKLIALKPGQKLKL